MSKISIFLSLFISLLSLISISHAQTVNLDTESKKTKTIKSTNQKAKVKVEKINETDASNDLSNDSLYKRQINQIEAQVNELKEEIFRSNSRLAILKESILASGLKGTELHIIHCNEMGANFKLERILYILDGNPIRKETDLDGNLNQEIEILNGPITSGNHSLQVELIYRGNGYGVFSYLQAYRFTLPDVHDFRTDEGKRLKIKVIAYEKGGISVDLFDRPALRFEETVIDLDQDDSSAPNSSSKK
jgi:hypothetical protein